MLNDARLDGIIEAFKIPLRFLSTCVAILFKALFFCCVLALRSVFAAKWALFMNLVQM
jgi:hypothetical protein